MCIDHENETGGADDHHDHHHDHHGGHHGHYGHHGDGNGDTGDSMGMHIMTMNPMMMAMNPTWFTLRTHGHVLFENIKVDTLAGIVICMVVTCLLSITYDILMYSQNIRSKEGRGVLIHALESLNKVVTVAVGYVTMLLVMTFNVWLLVSAVIGAGFSYFFCRPFVFRLCHRPEPEMRDKDAETKKELLHECIEETEIIEEITATV